MLFLSDFGQHPAGCSYYAATIGDVYAEFKEDPKKKKKREPSRTREVIVGSGQVGGGVLLGKKALDSGVHRLAGVRMEKHATSKSNARKIIQSGYLDPAYGGAETGVTAQMRLPKEFLERSKGHAFLSGVNPGHPDWAKRNAFSPIKDVAVRKIQEWGYRGSKAGAITDRHVQQGKKFADSLLTSALDEMEKGVQKNVAKMRQNGYSEAEIKAALKQGRTIKTLIKNPEKAQRILAKRRKVFDGLMDRYGVTWGRPPGEGKNVRAFLSKATGDYASSSDLPPGAMKRLWKARDSMGLLEGTMKYHENAGISAAWARKLVESPPKGAAGVGRTVYLPGTDEFFNNTKRFKFDMDDPFGVKPPFVTRGHALKTKEKVRAFGNRYSATGHAIREHGLLNMMKANPKRVLAGAAILGVGGTAAAMGIRSGVKKLKGKTDETKPKASGPIRVKGFLRNGKRVKGHTRKWTKP